MTNKNRYVQGVTHGFVPFSDATFEVVEIFQRSKLAGILDPKIRRHWGFRSSSHGNRKHVLKTSSGYPPGDPDSG